MKSILLSDSRVLSLEHPLIMGILNITPDSYYRGSLDETALWKWAESMIASGIDILDVGAMSSKPGSEILAAEEEIARLGIILPALRQKNPELIISIDTLHSATAQQAIDWGADIINDISFGNYDPDIFGVVRAARVPYIGMHMRGLPSTMQEDTNYENLLVEIKRTLEIRTEKSGLSPEKLIWDVGIGFGKSVEQNYELLANLDYFSAEKYPLLVGLSRKSFLYKKLNIQAEDALSATSAAHIIALEGGANILRVHDPKEAREVVKIWTEVRTHKHPKI